MGTLSGFGTPSFSPPRFPGGNIIGHAGAGTAEPRASYGAVDRSIKNGTRFGGAGAIFARPVIVRNGQFGSAISCVWKFTCGVDATELYRLRPMTPTYNQPSGRARADQPYM
jgi:hypothetical protein